MKKLFLYLTLSAFSAGISNAANTILASGDPSTPSLWSDSSSWDDGAIVNSETIPAYLSYANSSDKVGYVSVDGDYLVKHLIPKSAGTYHIGINDNSSLTIAATDNSLFFSNGNNIAANIYIDSGQLNVATASAIYLNSSGQSVNFSKDSAVSVSGDFKVRANMVENMDASVVYGGTVDLKGSYEVYGNSASGGSAAAIVSSTGTITTSHKLLVTNYRDPGTLNDNVGAALEVYGKINAGYGTVDAYAVGNSEAAMVIKNGGVVTFNNNNFVATAAANEDSAAALKVEQGGTLNAYNFVVNGNTFNTNKATAIIDGDLVVKGNMTVFSNTYGRVDVGETGSFSTSNLTVGSSNSTTAAVMNVAGGVNTVSNTLTVENYSSLNITGGELNINSLTLRTMSSMKVSGTGKINVSSNIIFSYQTDGSTDSQLSVLTAGNSVTGNIYMPECAKMSVGADNKWDSYILARGGRTLLAVSSGTFELNGILVVSDLPKTFELSVADGAKLILGSINGSVTNTNGSETKTFVGYGQQDMGSILNLTEFYEKTILFKEIGTDEENQAFLDSIRVAGQVNNDLKFSAYDAVAGGYWLTTGVVPEASDFAVALGAFALAAALLRRRK